MPRFAKLREALKGVPVTQSVMPLTPGSLATRSGSALRKMLDEEGYQKALARLAKESQQALSSPRSAFEAEFGMGRVLTALTRAAKGR